MVRFDDFTMEYETLEDGNLHVSPDCGRIHRTGEYRSDKGGYEEYFDPDPKDANKFVYSVRCKICGNCGLAVFIRNANGNWEYVPK